MPRLDSLLPVVLGLVLLCCSGRAVVAQEPVSDTVSTLAVSADASLGVQRLGGGTLASVGGRVWLGLPAEWRVGFGATWGLHRVDGGELRGSGLEATFGMGGATVAAPLPRVFELDGLEATLTLGSGSVSLENALQGTTVDRETVWILQPGIVWNVRPLGPFSAGVEIGYRAVFGADGLSRLEGSDLRTLTIGAVLSFPPR